MLSKMQQGNTGTVALTPLVAITLLNYAAQVPYFLHNEPHQFPGLRAVALLGATLAWFALGLAGFLRGRSWGFAVLVSFLVTEAIFYGATFASGAFIPELENRSDLLTAVFAIGYATGAVAGCYAYRLLRGRVAARLARSRFSSPAQLTSSQ
jgi:hypothetical protein